MPNEKWMAEIRQARRGTTTTDAQLKALTASTPTKALPRSEAGSIDGYKVALAARKAQS